MLYRPVDRGVAGMARATPTFGGKRHLMGHPNLKFLLMGLIWTPWPSSLCVGVPTVHRCSPLCVAFPMRSLLVGSLRAGSHRVWGPFVCHWNYHLCIVILTGILTTLYSLLTLYSSIARRMIVSTTSHYLVWRTLCCRINLITPNTGYFWPYWSIHYK